MIVPSETLDTQDILDGLKHKKQRKLLSSLEFGCPKYFTQPKTSNWTRFNG